MRDPRYDILFEPVQIGPVTARNRFYQVPHCNGMGYRDPSGEAYMRQVKAEGGWAVVCTEQVEIHPTSDIGPFIELRLWDDQDLPAIARIAERFTTGGALAGIELAHNGLNSPNLISRETPLSPSICRSFVELDPVQARAMTKADIARRSAMAPRSGTPVSSRPNTTSSTSTPAMPRRLHHFLSPRYNNRTDEYGGSIANRARLLREILEDTREVCDGKAAVACRISWTNSSAMTASRAPNRGRHRHARRAPDLWDFCLVAGRTTR